MEINLEFWKNNPDKDGKPRYSLRHKVVKENELLGILKEYFLSEEEIENGTELQIGSIVSN